jgi:hypothetical protein
MMQVLHLELMQQSQQHESLPVVLKSIWNKGLGIQLNSIRNKVSFSLFFRRANVTLFFDLRIANATNLPQTKQ